MAADNGNIDAQNNLGVLYEEENKLELAEKYYKMAADKNNFDACYNLGIFYENQDKFELAEKYLKICADNGGISSQYYLACMYEEEGKLNLAAKYFLKIAQHEDKKLVEKYMAEEDIKQLYKLIEQKIVNLDDLEEK